MKTAILIFVFMVGLSAAAQNKPAVNVTRDQICVTEINQVTSISIFNVIGNQVFYQERPTTGCIGKDKFISGMYILVIIPKEGEVRSKKFIIQ